MNVPPVVPKNHQSLTACLGVGLMALTALAVARSPIAAAVSPTSQRASPDEAPPTIEIRLHPPPNAHGWNSEPVEVSFACIEGGHAVKVCPSSVTLSTEGIGQLVSRTITDEAGRTATASVTLNLDFTPPAVVIDEPTADITTDAERVFVAATISDGLSGLWAGLLARCRSTALCPSADPTSTGSFISETRAHILINGTRSSRIFWMDS